MIVPVGVVTLVPARVLTGMRLLHLPRAVTFRPRLGLTLTLLVVVPRQVHHVLGPHRGPTHRHLLGPLWVPTHLGLV